MALQHQTVSRTYPTKHSRHAREFDIITLNALNAGDKDGWYSIMLYMYNLRSCIYQMLLSKAYI